MIYVAMKIYFETDGKSTECFSKWVEKYTMIEIYI